jgi:gliding motility-associated protein GldC
MNHKNQIIIEVETDQNTIPEKINWFASSSELTAPIDAKAFSLALWDTKEKNTMRIDLWTKEMTVDEMKLFYYQTYMTMADMLERATNNSALVKEIKLFGNEIAEKMEILKKAE